MQVKQGNCRKKGRTTARVLMQFAHVCIREKRARLSTDENT